MKIREMWPWRQVLEGGSCMRRRRRRMRSTSIQYILFQRKSMNVVEDGHMYVFRS